MGRSRGGQIDVETRTEHAGIVRTNNGLTSAKRKIAELLKAYDSAPEAPFSRHPAETRNLLVAAQFVVQGAIDRKVNVCLHYNIDQA